MSVVFSFAHKLQGILSTQSLYNEASTLCCWAQMSVGLKMPITSLLGTANTTFLPLYTLVAIPSMMFWCVLMQFAR